MPELTLSLDKDFWEVGIPLINQLDDLASPSTNTVDANTSEKHLFDDESAEWAQVKGTRTQITEQDQTLALHQSELYNLDNLKTFYGYEANIAAATQQKQAQQSVVDDIDQRLNTVKHNLANIPPEADRTETEEQTYQNLLAEQTTLTQNLDNEKQKLDSIEIPTYGNLQSSIDHAHQELSRVRTQLYPGKSFPNITSVQEAENNELASREKQQAAQDLLKTYKIKEATATTKAQRITASYDKIRQNMRGKLVELKAFKKVAEDNIGKAKNEQAQIDFHALHKSLQDMAKVSPEFYKELIQDVNQNFAATELDKKREEIKTTLEQNFSYLQDKKGSSHEAKLQVDLGAGVSALLGGARGTLSGVRTIGVSVNSFNQYQVTKGWDLAAGLMTFGGTSISESDKAKILAGADVDFNSSTTTIYNSLADLIDAESGNISTTFLDFSLAHHNWRLFEKRKNQLTQQEAIKQQKIASGNRAHLQQNLRRVGILSDQQELTVPAVKKVSHVSTKSKTLSGDAYAGATLRFGNHFGVGGRFELNGSRTTSYDSKTIHLIDDLAENPIQSKLYARRYPSYFGFKVIEAQQEKTYSGQEAVDKLAQIEAEIDALQQEASSSNEEKLEIEKQLGARRRLLATALGSLSRDYQTFVFNERKVNGGNNVLSKLWVNQQAKSDLNTLQQSRGAKNSVTYLQAVSLQYASLIRAYNKSFTEAHPANENEQIFIKEMQHFEQDLKNPPFQISKKDYADKFGITEETGNTIVYNVGADLMVANPKGFVDHEDQSAQASALGIRVGMKYSATTDPQGYKTDTMNINFNVPANVDSFGTNFVANILNMTDIKNLLTKRKEKPNDTNDSDTENEEPDADIHEITNKLNQAVAATLGQIDLQLYRKNSGFHIKYVRGYEASNKKVGGTAVIPVGGTTTARIGGSIALNQQSLIYESPGDNTLSYLTTLYNNKEIQDENNGSWGAYDQEYQLIDKMMVKLKDPQNNISNELEVWFKEMKEYHNDRDDLVADMEQKLLEFRAIKDADVETDDAKAKTAEFKKAFVKFVGQRTDDENAYYDNLFHTRRTVLGKEMREHAADVIAQRVEKLITTHSIPNESTESIESLKTWAKKRYNKAVKTKQDNENSEEAAQELQASFDALKSVFSVEYTSKMLEDLISSKKIVNQNEALNLLDTQLDALLKEQGKVYLDKGLTGELTMEADGQLNIKPVLARGSEDLFSNDKIAKSVENQMGSETDSDSGLNVNTLPAYEINMRNEEVIRQQVSLSKHHQLSRMASRSKRSFTNLVNINGNQKTISQYIAKVMQNALLKRQEQQRKAKSVAANK